MVQNLCIFRVCAKYVKSIFGRNSGLRNSMRTSGKCFEREIDYFGNDITSYTASSPEQCQIKCQGDSLCKAWTFNGSNNLCILKTSNSGKKASESYVTSGPKNCVDDGKCNHTSPKSPRGKGVLTTPLKFFPVGW